MKNLSLNAKMSGVFTVLIVGAVSIAVLGVSKMNEINQTMTFITNTLVPRTLIANDIKEAMRLMVITEKNIILEESKEGMQTLAKEFQDISDNLGKTLDEATRIASEEGKTRIDTLREHLGQFVATSRKIQAHTMEGRNAEAVALSRTEGRNLRLSVEKEVAALVSLNKQRMKEYDERSNDEARHATILMISTSIIAIVFGVGIAIWVLRSLSRSIDRVIADLGDNSEQVTTAAQQIATSAQELSHSATEQAASLEETSSATEEMSSMIKRNAEGARKSVDLTQSSSDGAMRGRKVVEEMIQAMRDIDGANAEIMAQITESNHKMADIVKVIGEIGSKTKVINEIVFQTKLLSFNASVEAARAGEHGKGFAVVAEEVGNLAQMSGNAAKEISAMLENSIQKVEDIAAETKTRVERLIATGKSKVEAGAKVADDCGRVLDEIVGSVASVASMVSDISTASSEQARGVEEITRAMTQLDQVTQQNAAVSEEAASAAEELSSQAEALRGVVQTLIQTIKGQKAIDAERSRMSSRQNAPASASQPGALSHASRGKVLHIKASAVKPRASVANDAAAAADRMKRAAGSDVVPDESDARFKDI